MMHAALPRPEAPPGLDNMVAVAAHCWRAARDAGAPAQRRLYMLLSRQGHGMLAPAFDSLMTLYEAALGRRIATDCAAPSRDERPLLSLIDGSTSRLASIDCAEGPAAALDCAIRSTQIMIALATHANPTPERLVDWSTEGAEARVESGAVLEA